MTGKKPRSSSEDSCNADYEEKRIYSDVPEWKHKEFKRLAKSQGKTMAESIEALVDQQLNAGGSDRARLESRKAALIEEKAHLEAEIEQKQTRLAQVAHDLYQTETELEKLGVQTRRSKSVLPYLGGKTRLSSWIIQQFPVHDTYVEVFGGSASVMINKPVSKYEVYNDIYSEIVNFFEILRDREEDLHDYIHDTPYSRELYNKYQRHLHTESQAETDPVARAGQFFLVANASINGDLQSTNGFKTSQKGNRGQTWQNKVTQIETFADRFRDVTIEKLDFEAVISKYDGPQTVFYCDPPYKTTGDSYYVQDKFTHQRLTDVLAEIDGDFVLSYGEIPNSVENAAVQHDWVQLQDETKQDTNGQQVVENLLLNYDPNARSEFTIEDRH